MGVRQRFLGRLLSSSDQFSDEQIAETLALFLEHAVAREANAVHIEPQGHTAAVRYRIGGRLHGLHVIPAAAIPAIARTLRQQADLPHQTGLPQEGTYRIVVKSKPVDVRVSIMPVLGGDKVVLHLSGISGEHEDLPSLGFWGDTLENIHHTLARPQGMVLVASPKHSRRTDTLYGLLGTLRSPSASLATVEDKVERQLQGVVQTTPFGNHPEAIAESINTLLRHDPNVVMVSNLPNKPAFAEAIRASHSGHMLLAGIYADDAVHGALHAWRLGLEPYLLATSLRLVIGQRTVRRLCTACRERYAPGENQLGRLHSAFGMTTAANRKRANELEQEAAAAGIGQGQPMNSTASGVTHLWRANPNGCEQCYRTGYLGTSLLTEALPMDNDIYTAIQAKPDALHLRTAAIKAGLVPLGLDGLVKALRGETTITEVLRSSS